MQTNKPRIFIGSSTESLNIANAIQEELEHDAFCKKWTQGIFELSESTLGNLLKSIDDFDYAIFVFRPDDITKIRDEQVQTVRDNVIFEFGLFLGKLGKEKVFFLLPRNVDDFHLPSDLLGITPGHYDPPQDSKDLLAALGPFCNKIRRILEKASNVSNPDIEEASSEFDIIDQNVENEKTNEPDVDIEIGVTKDYFKNYSIHIAPTVFFKHRIAKAFPGIRGLHLFDEPKEIIYRLELFLKNPLMFDSIVGHGVTGDPIWWFRGSSECFISNFIKLTDTRCLLDCCELLIDKMAIYQTESYCRCFLYIEIKPDEPVGIYPWTDEMIEEHIDQLGYAMEEYGLYGDIPISRTCYDDGAAVIDGKIVDTSGATLRIRYLSKYNFIIAPKYSPINSPSFDQETKNILEGILKGSNSIDDLVKLINILPKHDLDD